MPSVTVHNDHVLSALKKMDDNSVDCVVTSPPYFPVRDSPATETIWGGEDECDHKWDGPVSGESKGGSGTPTDKNNRGERYGRGAARGEYCSKCDAWKGQLGLERSVSDFADNMFEIGVELKRVLESDGTFWLNIDDSYGSPDASVPNKSLRCGPERIITQLIDKGGWCLRNKIIWRKPNAMPEPVTDRYVTSWEYIYLFSPSPNYKFSLEREDGVTENRNPRDVWEISTASFGGAHFAVFPEEIPRRAIAAGTESGDTVLDPFAGTGTTLSVAAEMNRDAVGIEIDSENIPHIKKRLNEVQKRIDNPSTSLDLHVID